MRAGGLAAPVIAARAEERVLLRDDDLAVALRLEDHLAALIASDAEASKAHQPYLDYLYYIYYLSYTFFKLGQADPGPGRREEEDPTMGDIEFHSHRRCPQCGHELWAATTPVALLLECPGCNWFGSEPRPPLNGYDSGYTDYAPDIRRED